MPTPAPAACVAIALFFFGVTSSTWPVSGAESPFASVMLSKARSISGLRPCPPRITRETWPRTNAPLYSTSSFGNGRVSAIEN